ncbi:MAG: O-antigen ligase family protein [Merismopediaceae bacterium]|nr:O-antigen ligase family protein [Merismopediaceae bacterium]
MTPPRSASTPLDPFITQGRLLAGLTAFFYGLLTLLPNSSSLVVSWPFVFIWQVALLTPLFWLLWQIGLGKQLRLFGKAGEAIAMIGILGLLASNLGAVFKPQAHWYGWAALGVIAGGYALHNWLNSPETPAEKQARRWNLFVKQGYLILAFIIISLLFWLTQTVIPYFSQLGEFQRLGVNLSFSFNTLELRNWAPIGHQNYVGGYLVLALPLLGILALKSQGKPRIFWLVSLGFGILDLYSTSSRGAWLAFVLFLFWVLGGLGLQGKIPKRNLGLIALGLLTFVGIIISTNDRFKAGIGNFFQGQSAGEAAYRWINHVVGWQMGSSQPLTGIGLGNVPLLYQKFRPFWAGRESEFIFQLHSTPAQLFAEMGLWGILFLLGAMGALIYTLRQWLTVNPSQSENFIEIWGLAGALFTYGVMSLTDYQLDNLCISGLLVIYGVILINFCGENRPNFPPVLALPKLALPLTSGGLACILVMGIWLFPIQRAWLLSSQGFNALAAKKFPIFVQKLTEANQLVPWEAYYPFQLGWNLGNLVLQAPNQTDQAQLTQAAIAWFEKGIQVSPYQEFAYNNTAWLQIGNTPPQATANFAQALNLVPAKRGVFYGLGISLLAQQKTDLAIQAFAWECLRDPLFMTSPFWRGPFLKPLYPQILAQVEKQLNQFLKTAESSSSQNPELITLLHQIRGGLYWWQGNFSQAQSDIMTYGTPTSQALLAIAQGQPANVKNLPGLPQLILTAWENPAQRQTLMQQAWIQATQSPLPPELEKQILFSMAKAQNFRQWLTEFFPVLQYRRERLGFGVNNRHIDGPNPQDFFLVVENLPMVTWFADLLPSPVYNPPFDKLLQPERATFLQLFFASIPPQR